MENIYIKYGNVAAGAKENFVPESEDKESFIDLSQLQFYNSAIENLSNPCELYQTLLDGTETEISKQKNDYYFGFWSKSVSGYDGVFENPISVNFKSNIKFSSNGFTLTFDEKHNIFCNDLIIKWFSDGNLVHEEEFFPDSSVYFAEKRVENFDEFSLIFVSLNMPKNKAKILSVDYGQGTIFFGENLKSLKLIQEIDPVSAEISINTADFLLFTQNGETYSFQEKQPISIFQNENLKATVFVKKATRKNINNWNIQCEDYIGLMDSIPFAGGVYENKNSLELLEEIFFAAKIPFYLQEDFSETLLNGYIPYTTCREALMQVLFALGAVADTSNSDKVNIYSLDEDVKHTIPSNRIMQGQTLDEGDTITEFDLTYHSYVKMEELETLYSAEKSGIGDEIFIDFSDPVHGLEITNGEIIEYGSNYAIINARSGCELKGKKYNHITAVKTRKNIDAKTNSKVVVSVENATLVSSSNVDKILELCYNEIVKSSSVSAKIVERKKIIGGVPVTYGGSIYGEVKYGGLTKTQHVYDDPINVGENISFYTEYMGEKTGRIVKQTFNLSGNSILKDSVIKVV